MKSRWQRPWRALFAVAAASVGAIALAGGCGSDNAVVGGDCANGYTNCDNRCVDLATDPLNCGACGHVCPTGVCVNGVCGALADGAPSDVSLDVVASDVSSSDGPIEGAARDGGDGAVGEGGTTEGGTSEGGVNEGGVNEGGTSEGGTTEGGTSEGGVKEGGLTDVACTPPYNTPQACGDCATQCTPPNGVCAPTDGGYQCAPLCPPPDILCHEICVNPTNDENNCGGCDIFCPTFICQNSMCVGSLPGEVVLIGHDYFTSIPTTVPQARVLTNAVFTRSVPTVRVLAYERYADKKSVTNATSILQTYAQSNNRPIAITATSNDADIPSTLTTSSYEILLVFDQPSAPAGALGPLGTSWQPTLTSYVKAGGIVVVLDGATAPEMPLFITNGGLLNVTAQTQLPTSTQVVNTAPGDTVGNGVASPYRVTNHSSRFAADAPSSNVTYVIFDTADNQPVVIHRVN